MILGLVEPTSGTISVLGGGDGRSVRSRIGFCRRSAASIAA